MIKEFDPARIVNLNELNELASLISSDVQPETTPFTSFVVSFVTVATVRSLAVTYTANWY